MTEKTKRPGKAGPIFRIVLAVVLAAVFTAFFAKVAMGLHRSSSVAEVLAIIGAVGISSAVIVLVVRLFATLIPPAVRCANAICSTLIPLNFAAVVFKLVLWLAIVAFPLQLTVYPLGFLLEAFSSLLDNSTNLWAIALFALSGVAALAAIVCLDIRRLKGRTRTGTTEKRIMSAL